MGVGGIKEFVCSLSITTKLSKSSRTSSLLFPNFAFNRQMLLLKYNISNAPTTLDLQSIRIISDVNLLCKISLVVRIISDVNLPVRFLY